MPVDVNLPKEGMIYQREQYLKGGIGRWYWDYRDEQVLKGIDDKKTIVDIGCGEGILMEKISQRFPDSKLLGIDPSPENVEICRRLNLNVMNGSVYELPLSEESADCLLFIEVIEHLENSFFILKKINCK